MDNFSQRAIDPILAHPRANILVLTPERRPFEEGLAWLSTTFSSSAFRSSTPCLAVPRHISIMSASCSLSYASSSLSSALSSPLSLSSWSTDPVAASFVVCLAFSVSCFVVSTLSKNYSQVDKLWSITPALYSWIPVIYSYKQTGSSAPRLLLMAAVSTVWSIRLTWNFNRRGGYHFPRFWNGDEDYRWPLLRAGKIANLTFLQNEVSWCVFNLTFVSFYQHVLLWLTAAPALVAWTAEEVCGEGGGGRLLVSLLLLVFLLGFYLQSLETLPFLPFFSPDLLFFSSSPLLLFSSIFSPPLFSSLSTTLPPSSSSSPWQWRAPPTTLSSSSRRRSTGR